MESGWSAEMVMPLTVDAIYGLRGRKAAGILTRSGNQDFYRVIRLMPDVKEASSIAFRIVKGDDAKETTVVFFYKDDIAFEVGK